MLLPAALTAQTDVIREAQQLRDARDFVAAVRVLQAHLRTRPGDGEAARLLAQTLYWMHDVAGARAVYEASIERHPADHRLRLDYGRMLAETGDAAGARVLVTPLRDVASTQADASTLLGTLAYWEGDLIAAKRLFTEALRINPAQADASRQLREIRLAAAPWIRISPELRHDDQPLDRRTVGIEAGWFPTPLTPVRVRVQPGGYRSGDLTQTIWTTEAEVRHFAPAPRLETELAVGVLQRTIDGDRSSEWTGRGVLGVRLRRHVTVRARFERVPYLYTIASLTTLVLTDVAAGELHWNDPRGWLGQAAVQRQQYPDDNMVRTVYAWVLAPILRGRDVDLQGGYAFGMDDADENRFVLSDRTQPYPPTDPRFTTEGRYDPYYTPQRLVRHSAIAAVTGRLSAGTTLRLGGSYGVRATEDAPVLLAAPGGVQRVFAQRAFSPWDLRASVDVAAGNGLTIGLNAETGRGSYYQWSKAGVHITYHFTAAGRRAADTR